MLDCIAHIAEKLPQGFTLERMIHILDLGEGSYLAIQDKLTCLVKYEFLYYDEQTKLYSLHELQKHE